MTGGVSVSVIPTAVAHRAPETVTIHLHSSQVPPGPAVHCLFESHLKTWTKNLLFFFFQGLRILNSSHAPVIGVTVLMHQLYKSFLLLLLLFMPSLKQQKKLLFHSMHPWLVHMHQFHFSKWVIVFDTKSYGSHIRSKPSMETHTKAHTVFKTGLKVYDGSH